MKFPGAQYADIDRHGVAHIAPTGFPADGLCRQMRCSRSGRKFAGLGSDDFVYEWVDGFWHDRGLYFGPRACIYRGEQLLIRRDWPAYGFRYIDINGDPVTATETYAHPSLPIWEYTELPNGWIVGQGGAGPWGEDPLVLFGDDGVRRLVQPGMCRFSNVYLSDDMSRVLLAWQQDGRGADARVLTLLEAMALPVATVTDPEPQPEPQPEPEPDMKMRLPEDVYETFRKVTEKFPHTHPEDEQQRRDAMKKSVATVRAVHGERYCTKTEHNTGYTNQSTDALCYVPSGPVTEGQRVDMFIWDMVDGTSLQPEYPGESEELRKAYLLTPPAKNWLTGEEPPPPVGIRPGEKHEYIRDDEERDECDVRFTDGTQCDQPKAAAIHQVVPKPDPGPGSDPVPVGDLARLEAKIDKLSHHLGVR